MVVWFTKVVEMVGVEPTSRTFIENFYERSACVNKYEVLRLISAPFGRSGLMELKPAVSHR